MQFVNIKVPICSVCYLDFGTIHIHGSNVTYATQNVLSLKLQCNLTASTWWQTTTTAVMYQKLISDSQLINLTDLIKLKFESVAYVIWTSELSTYIGQM